GDRLEQVAADGVDRAGGADGRIGAPFRRADELLVAPVEGGAVPRGGGAVVRGQHQLAAGAANGRIREVRDELAHGLRLEALARVREDDDLAADARDHRVDG